MIRWNAMLFCFGTFHNFLGITVIVCPLTLDSSMESKWDNRWWFKFWCLCVHIQLWRIKIKSRASDWTCQAVSSCYQKCLNSTGTDMAFRLPDHFQSDLGRWKKLVSRIMRRRERASFQLIISNRCLLSPWVGLTTEPWAQELQVG